MKGLSNISKQIPRELIAFAFIEDEYVKSGDIILGLTPLFSPLLADSANQIFDAKKFSQRVEEAYDIPMSELVAEGLIPKLAEARLLYCDQKESDVYRISTVDTQEFPSSEIDVDELISEFVLFAEKSIAGTALETKSDMLEAALVKRITSMQFLSFLDQSEKNYFKGTTLTLRKDDVEEEDISIDFDQALDVICAEYVITLYETAKEKFEFLVRVASGALIAEIICTIQEPSKGDGLQEVTVALDGPLLLDYLDLSSPELKEYATSLFKMIHDANITVAVFQHSIDEMKHAINAPLETVRNGGEPFGPLGTRIVYDKTHAAYARTVLDDLNSILEKKDIQVIDANDYSAVRYHEQCSSELQEFIQNSIGLPFSKVEGKIRDATSIATTLRLRDRKRNPKSLVEAGWVFITRNDNVSKHSTSCLIRHEAIKPEDFPPAITDRQLAGILWFSVGGNLGQLSKNRLIANCSSVINPRIDIISKTKQFLHDLDPEKEMLFTTLMRDERAKRCLVHTTLGFPAAITMANVEQKLEEIRLSTAEETRREYVDRERTLVKRHEEEIQHANANHQQYSMDKETEIFELNEKTSKLQDEVKGMQDQYNNIEKMYTDDVERRVGQAEKYANGKRVQMQVLIILFYALIVFLSYLFISTETVSGIAVFVIIALLGFWIVPTWLCKPLLKKAWLWALTKKANELQVSDAPSLKELKGDAINEQ